MNNPKDVEAIDKEYRDLVEEAIENNLNLDIPNSTLMHAVFLSQRLIDLSQKSIKILTGEFNSDYYLKVRDNLEKATERFANLDNKGEIKIIIWDNDATINAEFQEFANKHTDVIRIKMAYQTDGLSHFLISDRKRYRLEEPHTKEDLETQNIRGTANFCNPELADILDQNFETIWGGLIGGNDKHTICSYRNRGLVY